MNNKRGIAFLLIIVIVLVSCFQVLRTNLILTLLKNRNSSLNNGVYSSAVIPSQLKKEKFLIIFDSNEPNSINIKNNVVETLKYMKKDMVIENVSDVKSIDASYETVILTFENLDKLASTALLINYANSGGNVFFAERPLTGSSMSAISNIIGIKSYSDVVDVKGIKLSSNVLIKCENLSVDGEIMLNSSLPVILEGWVSVLAASYNGSVPLLWKLPCSKGSIMVFNGTNLSEKVDRGLIAGAISLLVPNFIYPVMGEKLTYIDDFPAPVPSGDNSTIYKEYGISIAQFYRDVWWPDILKGAKNYNLKYTGTIIENYTNNTTPSFESKISSNKDLLLFGSELIKSGGEIGIHGYNHQSLAPKNYIKQDLGYTPWKSISDMETSIKEAVNYAKSAFPQYAFRVYVPPSNILSPEGKTAIEKTMPDLKIISSIYTNNYLGDAYAQEFEVKNGIAELPRITSGYNDDEETKWSAYNGITSIGVFSHFIHPDDVLDSKRNGGKNWAGLLKDYNSLISNINNNFSWLRPATASEGAEALQDYSSIDPVVQYKSDSVNVYCRNFKENSPFILRSTGKVYSNKDCYVKEIDSGVFLVTAKKPSFSLKTRR